MERNAVYSEDRKYRYMLVRLWDRSRPKCVFIGLNPSTANELLNDPTVHRCQKYASEWGYGGLQMLNIFAFKATNPKKMLAAHDPVGEENDDWLSKICRSAGIVICAWGTHGGHRDRHLEVIQNLKELKVPLHCLGTTTKGFPKHPLYLKSDAKPIPFS